MGGSIIEGPRAVALLGTAQLPLYLARPADHRWKLMAISCDAFFLPIPRQESTIGEPRPRSQGFRFSTYTSSKPSCSWQTDRAPTGRLLRLQWSQLFYSSHGGTSDERLCVHHISSAPLRKPKLLWPITPEASKIQD